MSLSLVFRRLGAERHGRGRLGSKNFSYATRGAECRKLERQAEIPGTSKTPRERKKVWKKKVSAYSGTRKVRLGSAVRILRTSQHARTRVTSKSPGFCCCCFSSSFSLLVSAPEPTKGNKIQDVKPSVDVHFRPCEAFETHLPLLHF